MFIYIFQLNLCGYLTICSTYQFPPKENSNVSHYSVESLINLIINDVNKPRNCVIVPCGICKKTPVKPVHEAIHCDSCENWIHTVCNDISLEVYENLKSKSDLWHCVVCNLKNNLGRLPFTHCDNTELININNTNSMRFLRVAS